MVCLCSLATDLAECKLVSFPIGIYKVLRNVTDQIHLITLANNELKSLTSKFMTTFCQLRGRPWLAQARELAWLALTLQDLALLESVTRASPQSAGLRKLFPGGGFENGPASFLQPGNLCVTPTSSRLGIMVQSVGLRVILLL